MARNAAWRFSSGLNKRITICAMEVSNRVSNIVQVQTLSPACKTGLEIIPSSTLDRVTVTNQIPSEESGKVLDSPVRLANVNDLEVNRSHDIAFTLSRPEVVAHSLRECDTIGWRII